jgi:hypothetical protein
MIILAMKTVESPMILKGVGRKAGGEYQATETVLKGLKHTTKR